MSQKSSLAYVQKTRRYPKSDKTTGGLANASSKVLGSPDACLALHPCVLRRPQLTLSDRDTMVMNCPLRNCVITDAKYGNN